MWPATLAGTRRARPESRSPANPTTTSAVAINSEAAITKGAMTTSAGLTTRHPITKKPRPVLTITTDTLTVKPLSGTSKGKPRSGSPKGNGLTTKSITRLGTTTRVLTTIVTNATTARRCARISTNEGLSSGVRSTAHTTTPLVTTYLNGTMATIRATGSLRGATTAKTATGLALGTTVLSTRKTLDMLTTRPSMLTANADLNALVWFAKTGAGGLTLKLLSDLRPLRRSLKVAHHAAMGVVLLRRG